MIKILHGADLHLDSPFSSLPPQEAAACRARQRALPEKLVRLGNEHGCRIMLLAGDIFDSEEVHPKTLQALCGALAQFRGWVFIAPGNHDPYTDISVWAQAQWPENVHIFSRDYACVTLEELGCRVHGGAFLHTECLTALPQITRQGYVELGVFHGDCTTRSVYRPITSEQIEQSGLDYLALGHIHKRSMPRKLANTWYGWPGVAMGRGFDEIGPCGCLILETDGQNCHGSFFSLDEPTYEIVTVAADAQPQIPQGSENMHCRMRFVGQGEPVDQARIMAQYGPMFLSLQIVDETTPQEDLWSACGDGTLRGLALDSLRGCEDPELAELAARYLLAALEGRDTP